MNATNSLVLTGIVVTGGNWAEGKPLNIRVVIGVAAAALFLAVLDNADPDLASKFALLILVAAVWRYGVPLAQKAGLAK